MKITTASQMRAIDKRAIEEYGVPSIVMMECAGREVAGAIEQILPKEGVFKILVVAGPGNNGGDGFVAARYLANRGHDVAVVVLAKESEIKGDPKTELAILKKMDIEVNFASTAKEWDNFLYLLSSNVIVDAIFGTGFRPPIKDEFLQTVIEDINESGARVVSIDIPSGLSADSGEIYEPAVRANATVWLGYPKFVHIIPPAERYCGSIYGADLGLPGKIAFEVGVKTEFVTRWIVSPYFKPRRADTHKGDYGHLLVIGGSLGKSGAPIMAGRAALRAGAGLVTIALPESLVMPLSSRFPELMSEPLAETSSSAISSGALMRALELTKGKSAVAIGPGIGLDEETQEFVSEFIRQCPVPMVVDADALTALSGKKLSALSRRKAEVILTPHPGEMARLAGCKIDDVQADRVGVAAKFAKENNAILTLKGYRTVTALPDGYIYINGSGNPGMATAGSGDALTGIIGAFAGQEKIFTMQESAFAGVYLHGLAGDIAASGTTEESLTATDIIEHIPRAIRRITGEEEKT